MKKRLAQLIAVLCLLALPAVTAQAQGGPIITGQVVNGTQGGGPTAGLEVTAWVMQGEETSGSYSAVTDSQGAFRFENLPAGSGDTYYLETTYKDVPYSQGPLQAEPAQQEITATLPVYETTTDDTGISVQQAHLLLSVDNQSLSVGELYVFANPGDRTYIGKEVLQGQRWTSRFVLPANASGLAFDDGSLGGRFLATENGFVDTEALWPGSTSVMYRYTLPFQAGQCRLVHEITQPIGALNVLVPDTGVTVEGQGLQSQGTIAAQGQNYLDYVATGLQAGQSLDLTVHLPSSGAAPSRSTASGNRLWLWLVPGVIVIALILGYPFWHQRLQRAPASPAQAPAEPAPAARQGSPAHRSGSRRRNGGQARAAK